MVNNDQKSHIRVLHVVNGMDTGGVETWLMNVLRRINRNKYQFDFLTHKIKQCFYDKEIKSLGGRILPCLHPSCPWQYAWNFYSILKKNGPYHVIHSHNHHFSGITLMLARHFGVPVRIAHSHNAVSLKDKNGGIYRILYLRATEWLIRQYATTGLACSELAASSLFGETWRSDPRWQVFYCGIDLDPFKESLDQNTVRRELGIPLNAVVLGHVGRFSLQKNHSFLLDIFAEVVRRIPNSRLLLIGEGTLRKATADKAKSLGLTGKVIFAGVRSDVARLMMGAMDVFVFPSYHEGLPLTIVEAQAAGLRCLISETITKEVQILPSLIGWLSLQMPATAWANEVLSIIETGKGQKPLGYKNVLRSSFNIDDSIKMLEKFYEN